LYSLYFLVSSERTALEVGSEAPMLSWLGASPFLTPSPWTLWYRTTYCWYVYCTWYWGKDPVYCSMPGLFIPPVFPTPSPQRICTASRFWSGATGRVLGEWPLMVCLDKWEKRIIHRGECVRDRDRPAWSASPTWYGVPFTVALSEIWERADYDTLKGTIYWINFCNSSIRKQSSQRLRSCAIYKESVSWTSSDTVYIVRCIAKREQWTARICYQRIPFKSKVGS